MFMVSVQQRHLNSILKYACDKYKMNFFSLPIFLLLQEHTLILGAAPKGNTYQEICAQKVEK